MGGEDLSDMPISLYQKLDLETKHWYLKIMLRNIVIFKVNRWLIHLSQIFQVKGNY